MPIITQLATIQTFSTATTFVVVNNNLTRRLSYQDLRTTLSTDIGGGGGAVSRTTHAVATSSIAYNATDNISITGYKSYALLKVQTSAAAWVRLYTTSAARSSDSARSQGTDPVAGSGIIAEVITSGAQTQLITPGVVGFNDDATPATTIYVAVTNLSGATATITVTLTLLQMES
jgi:hypothetical protein